MAIKQKAPRPTVLRINRLRGRMLNLPAPKGKSQEVLVVYGLHCSIESVAGLAQTLNKHAAVTIVDLPGIGGMSSFYSIGERPLIENYASYLAAFIKLRYHRKRRIRIVALGEGLAFTTLMLQNHAKAAAKVDSVIVLGGIIHKNDIPNLTSNRLLARAGYRVVATKPISWLVARFRFGWLIKATHALKRQPTAVRDMDVRLWQQCDVRTRMSLKSQMLQLNVCDVKVDKTCKVIWANMPPRVDLDALKQHALVVYKRVSDFVPKHTIRGSYDLLDEATMQQSIGAKLRTWLER